MSEKVKFDDLQPADLPAPPQATARIVHACSNPRVGARELADIVASDPVLTAEILRTANSAYMGLQRKVRSATHAVAVLGTRSLRNIALCLAVRDAVKPDAIPGYDTVEYWEDAIRRAVSARILASKVGVDPDDAFTVGLLQDFGLLALFFGLPQYADRWVVLRGAQPEERREMEMEIFGATHDRVGLALARNWALPGDIAIPIACHHKSDLSGVPEELRKLCHLAMGADWMASVFTAHDQRNALERCRGLLVDTFGISLETVDNMLEQVSDAVEKAAASLGLRVSAQKPFEEVVREATRQLVEENLSYQELVRALEQALAERERLAQELKEANSQLQKLAYFDPLTGLANRRRFNEMYLSEIMRHGRSGKHLSLLMLDLDHFKQVNDTYGHPFGDAVLEAVSEAINDTLRVIDVKARVGGEELCALLPETDASGGQEAAERLRAAIAKLKLKTPTGNVRVTTSIGACTWVGEVDNPIEAEAVGKQLMDTADTALYIAKQSGRNRTTWLKYGSDVST